MTDVRDGRPANCSSIPDLGSRYFLQIVPTDQWVSGCLFSGVKRPKREADHLTPFRLEVTCAWSGISTPPYTFLVRCSFKVNVTLTS